MGFADEVDRRAAEFAAAGEAAEREAARQREQGAAMMRATEAFYAEARETLDLLRARGHEPEPAWFTKSFRGSGSGHYAAPEPVYLLTGGGDDPGKVSESGFAFHGGQTFYAFLLPRSEFRPYRMFEPRPRGTPFVSLGIEAPVRATPDGVVTIAGRDGHEFLVSSVARYLAR